MKNNEKMAVFTDHQYKEKVSLRCLSLVRMVQNTHLISFMILALTTSHLRNHRSVVNRYEFRSQNIGEYSRCEAYTSFPRYVNESNPSLYQQKVLHNFIAAGNNQ